MRPIPLIALLIVLFFSCSKKAGDEILPPEKMQAVLWDIIRADVYTHEFIRRDSTKNLPLENARLQKKIFADHKVSREQFYATYEYYMEHTEDMRILMDSMMMKQNRIRDSIMKAKKPQPESYE